MIEFGTGGWRAIIGDEFTKDNVCLLTQALADIINEEGHGSQGVVVGYDRRFLSDKAARWITQVLAGNGINVLFIEEYAPTPLVMYAVNKYKTPYGTAVTASHNAYDYNGIKVFTRGGRDADEGLTNKIEDQIARTDLIDVNSVEFLAGVNKGLIRTIDPFNEYIDSILSMLDLNAISKMRLKVLFDPMFGASKISLNTVLNIMRCQVDIINAKHNPLFGGRIPSPTSYTLKALSNLVPEQGYDLGLGTDGDGDRLGIVDERGEFVHPNDILCLLYYYFLEYKGWKGGVVRNIATTNILDRIAEEYGQDCFEVPVGFKHISSAMDKHDAVIGGESSGGLTIRGHIMGKDATIAAGLMIEMISVTGMSISQLMDGIGQRFGYTYFDERNIEFNGGSRARISRLLFEDKRLPAFPYDIDRISYRDGIKIYFKNRGWAVLRFSGTEPLLRVFVEMPTREDADKTLNIMEAFIQ
ncbi:MAG TPA: phosphoglucomutase/phosphomannomutase family protein [Clostridia bacterium]|nr:phosphoglucomutase/phosphomannomutase family protein [Clostridia bacterium]